MNENAAPALFDALIGQVAKAATAVAGLSGVVAGLNQTFQTMVRVVKGDVGGAFGALVDAAGKASAGILALGLAAAPGGIQVFGQVIEYLTSVIGSIAVPVFVILVAVVLTLADMLKGPFLEATKTVAKWLGDNLFNAIAIVVVKIQNFGDWMSIVGKFIQMGFLTIMEGISRAVGYVLDFIPGLDGASKALTDWADATGQANKEYAGEVKSLMDGIDKRNLDLARGKNPIQEGGTEFTEGLKRNLGSVVQSMSVEMGKKANVGTSGITDVWKTIQNAAFQSDIQSRTLKVQQEILGTLQGMAGDIGKSPTVVGP